VVNPAAVLRLHRPERRTLRGRLPGQPGRFRVPDHFSAGAGTPLHKVENQVGPGALAPGPAMDKQRTDTVAGRYRCGHRHFAVDVSVFRAHLLRSPSYMKTGKLRDGIGAILIGADRRLIRRQLLVSSAV
jgi:hypothetical protein